MYQEVKSILVSKYKTSKKYGEFIRGIVNKQVPNKKFNSKDLTPLILALNDKYEMDCEVSDTFVFTKK